MSDKTKAICDLLKVSFTGPVYIETMINTLKPYAQLNGDEIKTGEALESAKKKIQGEEFIKDFESLFNSLSVDELEHLTALHDSVIVEKFGSVCKEKLVPLFEAIQKEFIQD